MPTMAASGCEARVVRRMCPAHLAPLGTPTPSWSSHKLQPRSGVAARSHRPAIHFGDVHNLAIAIGCTSPLGFVVATRQQSRSCGRFWRRPLITAFTRRRMVVMPAVSATPSALLPKMRAAQSGLLTGFTDRSEAPDLRGTWGLQQG
jgi:hypothetical protein